jgi:transposase-like protein
LTTGKLNAVRAAFKAGVKPSAIARRFGISQSDVRKALAKGGRVEKPDLVSKDRTAPTGYAPNLRFLVFRQLA